MNYQSFLIKYSEIGLKGKNRYKFEDALVNNIRNSLREWGDIFRVYKEQERIYVDSNKDFYDIYDRVVAKLQKVFGISSISPIKKIEFTNDYKNLSKEVIEFIKEVYGTEKHFTFKVKTRRVNKDFSMHSDDVSAELGHDILEECSNTKVDVHNPDVKIFVEIRNHVNIYSERIMGPGGLPVGTSGKGMLLLSGGIDSPVAGYMIAKRGVVVEAIYFHAPPYTSERAKQKVIDLVLNTFGMYGGKALEKITHKEDPWITARNGYSDDIPSSAILSKDSIMSYFRSVHQQFRIDTEEGLRNYISSMMGYTLP